MHWRHGRTITRMVTTLMDRPLITARGAARSGTVTTGYPLASCELGGGRLSTVIANEYRRNLEAGCLIGSRRLSLLHGRLCLGEDSCPRGEGSSYLRFATTRIIARSEEGEVLMDEFGA